jgi:hypothetical protein
LKKDIVKPDVSSDIPEVEPIEQPSRLSDEEWVKSLNKAQKKEGIESCLDEYEATLEILGKHENVKPDQLKVAKSWCDKQKHTLRLLGYRKRLPAFGKSSGEYKDASAPVGESIFG